MVDDERRARIALSCLVEPGEPELAATVGEHGAAAVWAALRQGRLGTSFVIRAERLDLDVLVRQLEAGRLRFVIPGDDDWPAGCDDLGFGASVQRRGGVPYGLWVRGRGSLAEAAARSVAIVGSRASTNYGDSTAVELAGDLAEQHVTVVSGGAFGIDAAAHRGALSVGGPTVAVLACGVDVSYPPAHRELFARIAAENLLVSELAPGAHPTRLRFLTRNRLIAALTQGTVIVEAAQRSGAKNTANWARECARPLMALPGPVHSALSVAPHQLIRDQQATLVTSAADIVELISPIGASLSLQRVEEHGRPHGSSTEQQDLPGLRQPAPDGSERHDQERVARDPRSQQSPERGSGEGSLGGRRVRDRPLDGRIDEGGPRGADGGTVRATDQLDEGQLAVFEALPASGFRTPGEVALLAGVAVPVCLAQLVALEELGLVECAPRGWRIARRTGVRP